MNTGHRHPLCRGYYIISLCLTFYFISVFHFPQAFSTPSIKFVFPICPLTVLYFEVSVLSPLYFSLGSFRVSHLFPKSLPNTLSRSFLTLVFTAVICLSGFPSCPEQCLVSVPWRETPISRPWTEKMLPLYREHYFLSFWSGDMGTLLERCLAKLVLLHELHDTCISFGN